MILLVRSYFEGNYYDETLGAKLRKIILVSLFLGLVFVTTMEIHMRIGKK